jgi:NADPH:quinone reductase-like Zn-dependent oxidoreductase
MANRKQDPTGHRRGNCGICTRCACRASLTTVTRNPVNRSIAHHYERNNGYSRGVCVPSRISGNRPDLRLPREPVLLGVLNRPQTLPALRILSSRKTGQSLPRCCLTDFGPNSSRVALSLLQNHPTPIAVAYHQQGAPTNFLSSVSPIARYPGINRGSEQQHISMLHVESIVSRITDTRMQSADNPAPFWGGHVVRSARIIVTHYGGPDALKVIEEDCPEPKPGQVRVRVVAAGVSLPDVMAREGIHPETPAVPFTPGWDLVGVVDGLGDGVSEIALGQVVAAMPISGAYADFVCLPERELVPVPAGLDAGEVVSLILNYITAYQMLHRSAKVRPGQRVLIHGASGGVGTALLQLGRLVGLEMYGTCSSRAAAAVSELGGIPIDYQQQDFVKEIQSLSNPGADVIFDSLGGAHLWRSRNALHHGGTVVAYGLTGSLRRGRLISGGSGGRHRFRPVAIFGLYIAGAWLLPGRKRIVPYSIQTLKRLRPALFRQDLIALFELLQQQAIKPIIAHRFPLVDARHAHELLGKGGIVGKIVLIPGTSSAKSAAV